MKILILGGSWFIGKHLTKTLAKKNFEIWHFNRGKTPMSEATLLKGNRFTNETDVLCGKKFDVVVDLTCFSAQHFSNTFRYLRGHFKKYILLSSSSVKSDKLYGIGKHEAEQVIKRLSNYIIIRPIKVVGQHDYSNRFCKKNNKWYFRTSNAQLSRSSYVEVKTLVEKLENCIMEDKLINKTYLINERIGLMEIYN
ncbi:MAG: hypothetical protein ACC656_07600 [Candidatus Heimdallarchaeota archaeon]